MPPLGKHQRNEWGAAAATPPVDQSCRQGNCDSQIRVVIAGDAGGWQERFQRGLPRPDFLVERRTASPSQTFFESRQDSGCVVVADQEFLAEMNPAGEVLDLGRAVPIIAVAKQDTPDNCERLLRMGCSGIVSERVVPSRLRRAVRRTACGELWVSRQVMSKLLKEQLLGHGPATLTPRECEILGMIASGHSNRQIAEKLFISRETVRWHVRSLYAKTGVCDRAGLAAYSSRNGSMPPRKPPPRAVFRVAASSRG